jgi:poly-gamma-glutamate capsule biosynthesis protein CapA/YwtB (metallophosphatase superfamily)
MNLTAPSPEVPLSLRSQVHHHSVAVVSILGWREVVCGVTFSFFLIILSITALAANLRVQEGTNFGAASGQQAPSRDEVNHAIDLAAGYLERSCGPDGKFTYSVNIASGRESPSYDIIRHAGAMYGLAMANRSQPNRQAVAALIRATGFLRQNYIGPGVRPGQLVVWSKPIAPGSEPQQNYAELGGTGLGIVALAAVRQADSRIVSLQDLQALGRFALFLQKGDGRFVNKYSTDGGPVPHWESLYYPGEAALGFVALYEADQSREWLTAAAKALSFLAKTRARLSTVPADHWALIATARLLPYSDQVVSTVGRDDLMRHAAMLCKSILQEQFRGSAPAALDGAFDPTGRTAPAATRLEGLLAALEFLPEGELREKVEAAVTRGIAFLLRMQVSTGPRAGGMPGAFSSQAAAASQIRIDYVQHALCAWLRYKQLFQSREAVAKPLLDHDSGHIRILFGGDTDFGESYQDQYEKEGAGNVLTKRGYDYGLVHLSRLMQLVDYRILNLETPLTVRHDRSLEGKGYIHYSDPVKGPAVLGRFGAIAYSLANNHSLDQGEAGLNDTLTALRSAGARFFGAGKDLADATKPFIQDFQIGNTSLRVAIFGGLEHSKKYEEQYQFYATADRPGVAPIDAAAVKSAIRDLRRLAPHIYVIYFMHALANYKWKTGQQIGMANALRSAGVDLVIGSGAHMMQEIEYDRDQWVFYGIGNFLFNARGRYANYHAPPYSLILVVDFSMDDDIQTCLHIYPIVSDNKLTNYQSRFVTKTELGVVDALLAEKGHWNTLSRAAVKSGKDDIGYYLEFSHPLEPKSDSKFSH